MKKLFFSLILIITAIFATESPRAIIVFDASGSMWGQIDGKAKIEIARNALKNVVNEWNPKVELGLTVYGHRKKGDCNDIEMLIPVDKIDKQKVISTIFAIKPKGKTPISRSIKKAAEGLKYTEEKATIILISDGKETCDADPCATAKELEEKGIDFVTHVVGFNVDKKTDKQLECIAKATGGEYFSAKNATALNDAMKSIVKKVEKVEPPKPVVKKLTHNLEITASETKGGKWVDSRIGNVVNEKGKNVSIGTYGTYKKKPTMATLPVGKYSLTDVTYNQFRKKRVPFEIKAGETTKLNIVFGQTGKVFVSASETEGGKRLTTTCRIYNEDKSNNWNIYPRKKEDSMSYKQLPVGKYSLNCEYNAFKKKDIPVEIKAGETTKVNVVFGQTGKVFVSATQNGKRLTTTCRIYNEDKSNNWNIYPRKKEDSMSYKQLPIGKYSLNCKYNSFKKKDIPVEIKASETTKIDVNFTPFHLSIKGINQCSIVNHEVISPRGRLVTESKAPANKGADFVLPDGTYFIESTANGVTKKNRITIGGADATKGITVDFGGEDTKGSAEGEWKTSEGVAKIRLDGTKLQGSYSSDNGEIVGEMTYPQKFEGFWIEDNSNIKCSTAKNGRYHWGKVFWEFEDDMCSFKGKWGYCNKKPNSSWRGTFVKSLPKEPTKEELIKADSQDETPVTQKETKKEEPKKEVISTKKTTQSEPSVKTVEIQGIDPKDLKEAEKMLNALSGLFGGKIEQSKDTKAEKEKTDKEFDEMSQELDMFTK